MPEFTTQDYAQLSQNAYDISSSKDYTQCGGSYRLEKNRYFVLDRKNNPVNGFQGMIVAPAMKKDGKKVPDKSHIAVVYAGTNPDLNKRGETGNDISQDIFLFLTGANKNTTPPPPPPAPTPDISTAAAGEDIAKKSQQQPSQRRRRFGPRSIEAQQQQARRFHRPLVGRRTRNLRSRRTQANRARLLRSRPNAYAQPRAA